MSVLVIGFFASSLLTNSSSDSSSLTFSTKFSIFDWPGPAIPTLRFRSVVRFPFWTLCTGCILGFWFWTIIGPALLIATYAGCSPRPIPIPIGIGIFIGGPTDSPTGSPICETTVTSPLTTTICWPCACLRPSTIIGAGTSAGFSIGKLL
jgi:hypothetical protein